MTETDNTSTKTPIGHDTATTDEEEVAEALLAVCKLPNTDDAEDGCNKNAKLMPVSGPSASIDINPVQIKLGAEDISDAIENLPEENKLVAIATHQQSNTTNKQTMPDPRPMSNHEHVYQTLLLITETFLLPLREEH